jgi:hypothetical protein
MELFEKGVISEVVSRQRHLCRHPERRKDFLGLLVVACCDSYISNECCTMVHTMADGCFRSSPLLSPECGLSMARDYPPAPPFALTMWWGGRI